MTTSKPDPVRLPPPAELSMSIGEAMFTHRAIRRFDPDRPVSEDHIRLILEAASKAPTGSNAQPVRIVVVNTQDLIGRLGDLYHEAWWAKRADDLGWEPDQAIPADSSHGPAARFASEFGSVPAALLVFSFGAPGFSVYPAVQNMLLAARALGIGSVLTTLHPGVMDRLNALFAVPQDATFHCCVPLGHPRGRFGLTQRLPTAATTHWNRWGGAPPW